MQQVKTFKDDASLARAAAGDWLAVLRNHSGPYFVALSGGGIAKPFFAAIAELAGTSGVSLQNVHFFWADERCLPPDDSESNFRLANENLIQPLRIAPGNIHRLKGELPPQAAVAEANADISRTLPPNPERIPIFDLIFLGIGPDGHTASLMPNAKPEVLECREPYVHVDNSPKPPPNRLTLTYPVLAAAKDIWTLVAGQGKSQALRESLHPDGKTPFARVLQSRAQTCIYFDV